MKINKPKKFTQKKGKFNVNSIHKATKNTLKSIKDIAVTEISIAMPFLSDVTTEIKDVVSDINDKTSEVSKSTVKSFNKFNITEKVTKNIKDLKTNLIKDLTTGEWNRNDSILAGLGFDDMDEYDDDHYSSENVSSGETFVAEVTARSSEKLSNDITSAISSSTIASIEATNQIVSKNTKYQSSILNAGFNSLNSGIVNLVNFNATATMDHYNNSARYYTTMMENSATMISLLEDIKSGVSLSSNSDNSDEDKSLFRKIFGSAGDSLDIKELGKILTSQFKDDLKMLKDPIMANFTEIINSPMKALTKRLVQKATTRTREALEELDTGIQDLVLNSITRFLKNDTVSSTIGYSITNSKSITSGNYFKGDLRWNGYAQKSLMDVIPGYLSRIESFITKSPEIIFDYESGKWITKKSIKKDFDSIIQNEGNTAVKPIIDALSEIIDMKKLTKSEKESMSKAVKEFELKMMNAAINNRNVFSDIANNKILTESDVFNSALKILFKDEGVYKLDPKIKNKVNANLIRAAQNISDTFDEISKKSSSKFHLKEMESDIDYIIKMRDQLNYLSDDIEDIMLTNSVSKNKSGENNKKNVNNKFKSSQKIQSEVDKSDNKYYIDNIKNNTDRYINRISKYDVYDYKKNKITDPKRYLLLTQKRTIDNGLVKRYNSKTWYKFYKDFKDTKIDIKTFNELWSNYNFRISTALDLLLLMNDESILDNMDESNAESLLNELINNFKGINEYRTRKREYIVKNGYIDEQSSSLYGMSTHDFKKAKLKSSRELVKNREEELEDHIKDATDLSINAYDKDGNYSVLRHINSVLSVPDKLLYGMFKKVDKYVFSTLFDDGRFFGDDNYKGLIPTIKDEVKEQMKTFGDDLNKEIIDPLVKSMNDGESNTLYHKIVNKLGIEGDINDVKKNISKYFNGERDENGNLIHVGLKHTVLDSMKNDIKSIYSLGKDTVKDLVKLGNNYDGAYADGGIIGKRNKTKHNTTKDGRPDYDSIIDKYAPEKDALTEHVSKILWNSGSVPAFSEGGKVETDTVDDVSEVLPDAVKTKVISHKDGGVVITAQSGESVLTREQTQDLLRRLKIHIKNGTASPEDIELARSLGIKVKISGVRKAVTDKISNYVNKLNTNYEEDDSTVKKVVYDITDTVKDVFNKTADSLFSTTYHTDKIAKSKEMIKLFGKESASNISDIISGGAIGGGLSLLTGLVNPFLGVSLGAGIALASKSNKVQTALFGDDMVDGIMNKDISSYIKEKLPKTAMGGILGSIGSTMLLGSPVPGLLLGSSMSHAIQSDELRQKLFGSADPEKILKSKEKMKKILPASLIGAGALALTGPFGLVGNILLGGTLGTSAGIMNASGKLEKAFFGEKASDGKYYGGLLPSFREIVLEPMGDHLSNLMKDVKHWFKDAIYDNLKRGLSPLGKGLKGLFKLMWRGTKKLGKKAKTMAGNTVAGRLAARAGRKITKGILNVARFPLDVIGGTSAWIGQGIGYLGDKTSELLLKSAAGSGEYTSDERVELLNKFGLSQDDDYLSMYTDLLQNDDIRNNLDNKLELRDSLRYIRDITDPTMKDLAKKEIMRDTSKKLNSYANRISKAGGWKNERKYVKTIKSGNLNDVIEFLRNDTTLDEDIKTDLLQDALSKQDKFNRLNKEDVTYNDAIDELRMRGFSDDLIDKFITTNKDGKLIRRKSSRLEEGLSYLDRDINKHYRGNLYDLTLKGRESLGNTNRLKSVDKLITELHDSGKYSDLKSLEKIISNMHLSGDEIETLIMDGVDTKNIRGYNSYQKLKELGIDDELINTFTEKDKIALAKSIRSHLTFMKDDDGNISENFKFDTINDNNEPKSPKELVSIDNLLQKYIPILAASTGVVDTKDIKDDLKNNNIKDINHSTIEDTVEVAKNNTNEAVEKIKNDDVTFLPDGKKQIKDSHGNIKFDLSDKNTKEIIKEEKKEKEMRHGFYNSFSLFSYYLKDLFSRKGKGDKEENKGGFFSNLFGNLSNKFNNLPFMKGAKIWGPIAMFLGPSILNKMMGNDDGVVKSWAKSMGSGLSANVLSALGLDTGKFDGSTSSDEEDIIAEQNRTYAQNLANKTLGKMFGRSGYMGEGDYIQSAFNEVGYRNVRNISNFTHKSLAKLAGIPYESPYKIFFRDSTNLLKKSAKGIGSLFKNGDKALNNIDEIVDKGADSVTKNVDDIAKTGNSFIDKFKNMFSSNKKATKNVTEVIDKSADIGKTVTKADSKTLSKFNKLIDNLIETLNKVPDFGEVIADNKVINTLTSFCDDKSTLKKIDFNKVASSINKAISKIKSGSSAAIDKILKGGQEAISKFMSKTVKKGITSSAKLIPYVGVALIVIDVISGMTNYKDLLGISNLSDLSLLQQILYRVLAGAANAILNLPFIWVASLLMSEEVLMDIILEIGDAILPGQSELTKLRNEAKSEINEVNKALVAQGKDEISTVTQLNEYYKRNDIDSKSDLKPQKNVLTEEFSKATASTISQAMIDAKKYVRGDSFNTATNNISINTNNVHSSNSQTTNQNKSSTRSVPYNAYLTDNSKVGVGGDKVTSDKVDFVGKYVKHFESGNSGSKSISDGKGDYGGVSYGSFQFASFAQNGGKIGGSAKTFWENNYKKKHPNVDMVNNDTFKNTWISEVDKNPNEFFKNEHNQIIDGYYNALLKRYPELKNHIKSRALQESILSTTVQYGVGLATSIFKNAIKNAGPNATQSDIINAIQDYKSANVHNHFSKSSKQIQNNLKKGRIEDERKILLPLSTTPIANTGSLIGNIKNYNGSKPDYTLYGADPSTLDGEGNTSISPNKGFLGLIESLNNVINDAILKPIKNLFTPDENGSLDDSVSETNDGSTISNSTASTLAGITNADDHFGFKVTSKYGEARGSYTHSGIDYGMPEGTKVITPVGGKVEINKTNPGGFGEYVGIRDDNKMLHIFGHLKDRSIVSKGSTVKAGDVIGISGNTGASTGPHLHYEVTNTLGSGRQSQDPNAYLAMLAKKAEESIPSNSGRSIPSALANTPLNPNSVSTTGTGGQLTKSSVISSNSLNNNKVIELLTKIISLLTIGNANTNLLNNVVSLLSSISNGNIIATNDEGRKEIENISKSINNISDNEELQYQTQSILKQLQSLAM